MKTEIYSGSSVRGNKQIIKGDTITFESENGNYYRIKIIPTGELSIEAGGKLAVKLGAANCFVLDHI
jgi:hypothetical protein